MPAKRNNQPGNQGNQAGKSTEHPILSLTLGKTVLPHRGRGNIADLVIDVAVVDWVNVDFSIKRNTNIVDNTTNIKKIVDVVSGIDNATIIKKIVAYIKEITTQATLGNNK